MGYLQTKGTQEYEKFQSFQRLKFRRTNFKKHFFPIFQKQINLKRCCRPAETARICAAIKNVIAMAASPFPRIKVSTFFRSNLGTDGKDKTFT